MHLVRRVYGDENSSNHRARPLNLRVCAISKRVWYPSTKEPIDRTDRTCCCPLLLPHESPWSPPSPEVPARGDWLPSITPHKTTLSTRNSQSARALIRVRVLRQTLPTAFSRRRTAKSLSKGVGHRLLSRERVALPFAPRNA